MIILRKNTKISIALALLSVLIFDISSIAAITCDHYLASVETAVGTINFLYMLAIASAVFAFIFFAVAVITCGVNLAYSEY